MTTEESFLYVRLNSYKRLLNRTHQFIKESLGKVVNPYVACSFGKDSNVMLHLVLCHKPNIPIVFLSYPETDLIDNYPEVISAWGNLNLYRLCVNADILDEVNEKDILPAWAKKNGYDSAFVGLRRQESVARRITIAKYGPFAKFLNEQTRICPLADWTTKDIAAYTVVNQLPVLNTYQYEGFQERTVSGIAGEERGFRTMQLRRLKTYNINRYNALLITYPELANYV